MYESSPVGDTSAILLVTHLISLAANTGTAKADAISNPFDESQPNPQLLSRILGGSVLLPASKTILLPSKSSEVGRAQNS